jgi:nitroimidazol reductase NimA-like FMN-containing flavoprotein (pyridoxamine 5'-phosphate oxidase superfamily)
MKRRDKVITSRDEIDAIIRAARVCRIAMANHNEPYVVPVSFGYDREALYIHTAKTGRKIDFIEANNRVCFELEAKVALQIDARDPCAWTFAFESVIGFGTIVELDTAVEKARGLNHIMLHYSGREWDFDEAEIANTRVWRIDIESITGKRSVEKDGAMTS